MRRSVLTSSDLIDSRKFNGGNMYDGSYGGAGHGRAGKITIDFYSTD